MKNHIRDTCKLDIELVLPGCNRGNAAKVGHAQLQSPLPQHLSQCSQQLPIKPLGLATPTNQDHNQSDSNVTPNVLACAHLSGPFDYNKMPLAPFGCEAQVHKKTNKRGTWAYISFG
jgi:hypothetical protein